MNYRIMFLINALVAVLLGLGCLAAPERVLDQFGVDGYAATRLLSQFFGTALLGLGLLLWFAKDVTVVASLHICQAGDQGVTFLSAWRHGLDNQAVNTCSVLRGCISVGSQLHFCL